MWWPTSWQKHALHNNFGNWSGVACCYKSQFLLLLSITFGLHAEPFGLIACPFSCVLSHDKRHSFSLIRKIKEKKKNWFSFCYLLKWTSEYICSKLLSVIFIFKAVTWPAHFMNPGLLWLRSHQQLETPVRQTKPVKQETRKLETRIRSRATFSLSSRGYDKVAFQIL